MIRMTKLFKPQVKPKTAPQTTYVPLKYTLMGSFLLLIIPILIAMSISDYFNAKHDLEDAYKQFRIQTESNITNAITLADAGHKVLARVLSERMKEAFEIFIEAYAIADRDPAKMNLDDLKKQLGGKMDLYIITTDNRVAYTTYKKDLGLDFSQWPDYVKLFDHIRQSKQFYNSGTLASEARTGTIRNFAYQPTVDGKYLFELGLQSDEFSDLMGELNIIEITKRLKGINSSLSEVRIFNRQGKYSLGGDEKNPVEETVTQRIKEVYQTRRDYEITEVEKKLNKRYIFVNLQPRQEMMAILTYDPSKIIELTYNTRFIDDALQRTAAFHFLISIIAIVLSIVFTFIISAWITRPIQKIVDSVNIIAKGNLQHHIEVETNNELKLLKQSIIIMVDSMLAYINKIKQQNDELKELDKLKDDFLSNTSHELRTPINGIIGIADSMIDGAAGPLPAKAVQNLSMIVLSGRRLSNLVNDILDFSKLKHKNIELQIKSVEIKVVIEVVLTLSKPLIGTKKLELIDNVMEDHVVDADENRVQQILHNLISNAIKFTEAGSVEVSTVVHGDYLMITIADTGIGIQANKIERIFRPFEQADGSISREYGGTGLGLSITKQLVELHGGQISIESSVGVGTKVSFTLPLSKTQVVEHVSDIATMLNRIRNSQPIEISIEEKTETTVSPEETNPSGPQFNILIVDDDSINLQVLDNQLRLENYAVTRANNGQEALDAVNSGIPFVIILLDIMMPKMSGFEVCKIIREKHPVTQLPIIMLTAKNQVADLVEGLQAGANDYLTKPFSKGELLTRIKTHIQLSRVNIAYSNFVPLEFLKLLEKESIVDVRLGDHVQKHMAVLFADIRSFTTLSESMTPKENFDFINSYLGSVSPVIRKHHGFIDKYIGDAIMALFSEQADDAVQASIEIHKQLVIFNADRQAHHLQPIKIGIGLHIGTLMLGTIGEEKRMEGTVISDAVNLASRLEGLTKMYGASIIVSEQILKELANRDQYSYRFLGKFRVKGKKEAVEVFEILDAELPDIKRLKVIFKPIFKEAIEAYYQKQFKEAARKFQYILSEVPQDQAASFYLERCQYYFEHGPPQEWDGIEALSQK